MLEYELHQIEVTSDYTKLIGEYNDIEHIISGVSTEIDDSLSKIVILLFNRGGDTLGDFAKGYENIYQCIKCDSEKEVVSILEKWFFSDVMGIEESSSFFNLCKVLNLYSQKKAASELESSLLNYARILQEIKKILIEKKRRDVLPDLEKVFVIFSKLPTEYDWDNNKKVVFLFMYGNDNLSILKEKLGLFSGVLGVNCNIYFINVVEDRVILNNPSPQIPVNVNDETELMNADEFSAERVEDAKKRNLENTVEDISLIPKDVEDTKISEEEDKNNGKIIVNLGLEKKEALEVKRTDTKTEKVTMAERIKKLFKGEDFSSG